MREFIGKTIGLLLAAAIISLPLILFVLAWKTHWILGTIATVVLVLLLAGDGEGDMPSHV